jgi:hypothetical protein
LVWRRVLILLVAFPALANGHAEIFFPRLFSPSELASAGFVFLNPEPFAATVTVVLLDGGGFNASDSRPQAVFQVPPGGQIAKLGGELFPNAANGGWVYANNDSEGMQAFWLSYDAGITFLDGAEAAQYDTIGPDQIIPLVSGQAELNVINPNFNSLAWTARLFGAEGELAAPHTATLPIAGAFRNQVSAMFPGTDMSLARYIRIQTLGAPIASSVFIRNFLTPTDAAVLNGENAGPRTELDFPHIVSGMLNGADYTTVIGVTNLSASGQTVTITFSRNGEAPIEVSRVVSGSGALRETAQTLFGLTDGFQSGWVRVRGAAPVTGFAAYGDTAHGGLAAVPAGAARSTLFFSHIANGEPQWQTGLALLNAGSTAADVEIFAMTPSGSLIGRAAFVLEPGRKMANAIHELIPQTSGVNGGFIVVRTTNNAPLNGIELFYTQDLKVLSNVAAGKLAPGIVYSPPSP